ncbi:hypothetical protein Clacol_008526 [Clathrus columnatus]|uniref:Uncharacterized protein n=1 Tax=Clathrus columnatus TaxID=1419009 RepID=A0AAV5AKR9_9AGAM|nr:hypothetical protein Clacol_008526 [Clathrus columnatus]
MTSTQYGTKTSLSQTEGSVMMGATSGETNNVKPAVANSQKPVSFRKWLGFREKYEFVLSIRNKAPFIHRYIGYTIMTLLTLGNIAIAMISPISMGGNDLSLTLAIIFLIISTSTAMGLAWYNIRKQQIDEHRKWMLRAMFWMGIIVTMRLFMIMVVSTISCIGGYATLWTCAQAQSITGETIEFYNEFPECRLSPKTYIGVPADLKSRLHVGSAIRLTFAMTTWLAISVHTLAVEVYIHLTPKENDRLRLISYHKQLALGLHPAGSAGLTADRLGSTTSCSEPTSKKGT